MTKRFIIFIPFHNPWEWHTDYANQTALLLSRTHAVFCFLWGDIVSIKEIISGKPYRPLRKKGKLLLYQPLALLPGKRFLAIQFVNLFLNLIFAYIYCSLLSLRSNRTLLFWYFGIYDPAFLLLPLFFRSVRILYDCVDAPSHPDPEMSRRLQAAEDAILRHAWIVTANSATLHKRLQKVRPDTHHLPLGFREEMFHQPKKYALPFPKHAPVAGYIGAIDYRLDITLLLRLVRRHPAWYFALIGPISYDFLSENDLKKLHMLLASPQVFHDSITPEFIPDLLRQCSVTVIPYHPSLAFNRYAFPMKTMEYLYAQKRIITNPIIELRGYTPLIRTAGSITEWERELAKAFKTPLTAKEKQLARRIAMSHTWDKKISQLLSLLSQTPE